MTSLPILQIGDPRLRRIAEPLAAIDLEASLFEGRKVARALSEFRRAFGWGRALAAPQVGVNLRMVAFEFGQTPFLALNPSIAWRSEETEIVFDDCLCLPGIAAPVRRNVSVTLEYLDERMAPRRLERLPFDVSELVQHEVDHLDGVLFVDRVVDTSKIIAREHKGSMATDASRPESSAK